MAEKNTTRAKTPKKSADGGNTLIIVESPSKAKTINKYLGKDYTVLASVGHIKELPRKEIGIDFENGYSPRYETIAGKDKVLKELKSSARISSKIVLATDPDREGEAIAWHISNELESLNIPIERALFNEITPKAIKEALQNTRLLDMNLIQSQQARQGIDKIVGYEISPFLWKTVLRGLSAGRVQSVALRLLCERQAEIDIFISEEYWSVVANFSTTRKENIFAKLIRVNGNECKISNQEEAKTIVQSAQDKNYTIVEIKKREQKRNAPPPFTTSLLQQAASNKLGFGSKKTMRLAQQLYEGIAINGETIGLITYMRTDSKRISKDAQEEAKSFIIESYGESFVSEKAAFYKTAPNVQDAHEAIRPTSVYRRPQEVANGLDKDQYRLYELIWQRFLASQMSSAQMELVAVDIADDKNSFLFRANGRTILFEGFLKAFGDQTQLDFEERKSTKEDETNSIEEISSIIPKLIKEKDSLGLESVKPNQHFTKPPAKYSEASLVKELDNYGIGRPSTYASILSTLVERRYAENLNRRLTPTELGKDVNKILIANFSNLFNVEYTAKMENELDKIATGEIDYEKTMDEFYLPFKKALTIQEKNPILPQNEERKICPSCEKGVLVTKWTKSGKFFGCSKYPKCKHIEAIAGLKPKSHETIVLCPKCEDGSLLLRDSRFGQFLACSKYPACDGVLNLSKDKTIVLPKPKPLTTDIPCPKCKSPLYLRNGKRGEWLGCSKFPKCRGRKPWSELSEEEQLKFKTMLADYEKTFVIPVIKTIAKTPLDLTLRIEDLVLPEEESVEVQV